MFRKRVMKTGKLTIYTEHALLPVAYVHVAVEKKGKAILVNDSMEKTTSRGKKTIMSST